MKRLAIVLGLSLASLALSACSTYDDYGYGQSYPQTYGGGPGYRSGGYSGGAVFHDSFYNNYYGPVHGGYWGADNYFYYEVRPGAGYLRDHQRHFRRDPYYGAWRQSFQDHRYDRSREVDNRPDWRNGGNDDRVNRPRETDGRPDWRNGRIDDRQEPPRGEPETRPDWRNRDGDNRGEPPREPESRPDWRNGGADNRADRSPSETDNRPDWRNQRPSASEAGAAAPGVGRRDDAGSSRERPQPDFGRPAAEPAVAAPRVERHVGGDDHGDGALLGGPGGGDEARAARQTRRQESSGESRPRPDLQLRSGGGEAD
ncbi:MAG: hypothetical protein SGJ21_06075 [Alphaproteobacteria bacterium]|nr:hypothetical protein [Alphaproteobacteria bacterium]